MTRPEKLRLIEGVVESWIQFDPAPGYYVGTIRGVERLGLPPLLFHDAQSGFRTFDLRTIGTVTSWPSMGALSATWDERLARQMGEAVGLEFRKKGANGLLVRTHTAAHTLKPSRSACFSLLRLHFQFATPPHSRLHPFDALLYPMPFPPLSFSKGKNNCLFHCIHQGPGVDIARVPSAGRNAESLCGEDGHLGAPLAREYIRGVQSQGVAAVAKHFIANLQESDARPPLALDPILSLLLEAYCESSPNITLKQTPTGINATTSLTVAVTIINMRADDRTLFEVHYPPFEAAIEADVASIMCSYNKLNGVYTCNNADLLKTHLKGVLGFQGFVMSDWWAMKQATPGAPNGLDMNMPGTIHFIDRNALSEEDLDQMAMRIVRSMIKVGAFDWEVPACIAPQDPSCLQLQFDASDATRPENTALARQIASEGAVLLQNDGALPLETTRPLHIALVGSACDAVPNSDPNAVPWYTGDYYALGGSSRVMAPASSVISIREGLQAHASVQLSISNDDSLSGALIAIGAPGVEMVIACGATTSGEFFDRSNLEVDQHAFLVELAASRAASGQPLPLVVVTVASGAILTDFRINVNAHVHLFQSGQATGDAVADVLFGVVNPSGKLPLTFPISPSDVLLPCVGQECILSEGLFVGWKAFLGRNVAYPFGHGLSYTSFDLTMARAPMLVEEGDGIIFFSVSVSNSGTVNGSAVAQVYLSFPDYRDLGEPEWVLRAYQKTSVLQPGASITLDFILSSRDLSIWMPCTFGERGEVTNAPCSMNNGWYRPAGTYTIMVGQSSRDVSSLSYQVEVPDN
ncbi:MAG: hypothetical protein SGPRY_012351, partial [Prymnesium sp.]